MLEGFKAIIDRHSLNVFAHSMRDIRTKLLNGKPLTNGEENELKHDFWGMEGLGRAFRDDKHRLQLIEQWLREKKLHYKRLKEQEEQNEK
jgi:hypothetical protein